MTHETQGREKWEKHMKGRLQLLGRLGGEALFTKILDSERDGQGVRCSMTWDDGLGGVSAAAQQNCLADGCRGDSGVWKRKLVWKKTNAYTWIKDSKIILQLRKRSWEAREGGREGEGEVGRGRRE